MKIKNLLVTGALLLCATTFAQKEELKTLKKIYAKDEIKGEDLATYKATVAKLETLATEEGDKVYSNFYKGMLPLLDYMALDKTSTAAQQQVAAMRMGSPKAVLEMANALNTTLDFEKKSGKKIYTDDINETITSFKPIFWEMVVAYDKQKMYKQTAEMLYAIYSLDKKDQEKLYLTANYDLQANDYDKALEHFQELKNIGYTGEKTLFIARNKASDKDETFDKKEDRDAMLKLGTHILPKEEKVPSKKGEIVKNIALILVEKGKTDEAKAAFAEAKKENPNDTALLLAEADMYYKMKDLAKYQSIVNDVLAKNPNDHELIYNLGVTSADLGRLDEAERYYKRTIELKPDYYNAYLNLADLKLKPDAAIVKEINSLGTSDKDLKKYEALKVKRQKLFTEALPILEKAHELNPEDETVKTNLLSVYRFLEMEDKAKALKAKM